MSQKTLLVTIGAIVVLAGGGYALKNHSDSNKAHEALMMHQEAMHKKDAETAAMKKTEEAAAMKKEEAAKAGGLAPNNAAITKGSYISYAIYNANKDQYKDFKVVLFFHAPWCPTCQALEKNIKANLNSIPDKTILVKTDYDTSTDLKKKYGITYQHTMVQVDASGTKIKKWAGSPTLSDLVAQIQA